MHVAAFELDRVPVSNAEFLVFVKTHAEWRRDRVAALLARLRERSAGPEDYIEKIFTGWRRDLERFSFELGCIVAMSAIELGPRSPEMAEAAKQAFSRWESEIAAAARDWGMDDSHANRFAAAAISAIEGALVMSRVRRDGAPFDLAAESVLSLARAYLRNDERPPQ